MLGGAWRGPAARGAGLGQGGPARRRGPRRRPPRTSRARCGHQRGTADGARRHARIALLLLRRPRRQHVGRPGVQARVADGQLQGPWAGCSLLSSGRERVPTPCHRHCWIGARRPVRAGPPLAGGPLPEFGGWTGTPGSAKVSADPTYLVSWKSAVWAVPSASLTTRARQVPGPGLVGLPNVGVLVAG